MRHLFLFALIILANQSLAKKKRRPKTFDESTRVQFLIKDIKFLASDSLEGRCTGTKGEEIAANYIAERFKQLGILPFQENYIIPFEVKEGYKPSESTNFYINDIEMKFNQDYFPLPFGMETSFSSLVIPNLNEAEGMWLVKASAITSEKLKNPHEGAMQKYKDYARKAIKDKCKGLIIYATDTAYDYEFKMTHKDSVLEIPVVFISSNAASKYIIPNMKKDWIDFKGEIEFEPKIRNGKNVAAFINNNAKHTVIIGAHYDHLGYGQDHNSRYTGTDTAIHNGADDNASGTAGLISLAEMIKQTDLRNKNYLFVAFSGEELGLYGSKKFTELYVTDTATYAYMINMDMIGRLNDSTKALTIGGIGTSSIWAEKLNSVKHDFILKYDSSGVGPSDHTSFYLKNLPVLFYFTGLHTDYHKPSDDADKINYTGEYNILKYIYSLVQKLDNQPKPDFIKTKEKEIKSTAFKVTLGIMPDYTFLGPGVKADGVTDSRPAQRAGVVAGDVILKLGNYKVEDMQTYMEALSKFQKGDATQVLIKRNSEEKLLNIKFE